MRIALTGSTGFLGKYIREALQQEVITIGRNQSNDMVWDFQVPTPEFPCFDRVVHAAGKAHSIPKTKAEAGEFFAANLVATKNLLHALEKCPPKQFVFISSVAVYGVDAGENITEDEPLNGTTPYAKSKIDAEHAIKIWCAQHQCKALILRLPLITGTNPPGNLSAIIRAIKKGYYFRIGAGEVRKSMVSALDVAALISQAAEAEGTYNLTDGLSPSIADVDRHLATLLGRKVKALPISFFGIFARIGDLIPGFPLNSLRLKKLCGALTFDDNRARKELGWKPSSALYHLKL
jgi:nucleoside-diphosphate-sugar epimerase